MAFAPQLPPQLHTIAAASFPAFVDVGQIRIQACSSCFASCTGLRSGPRLVVHKVSERVGINADHLGNLMQAVSLLIEALKLVIVLFQVLSSCMLIRSQSRT